VIYGIVIRAEYVADTGSNQTELIYVDWHVPSLAEEPR
jgi:hypothetical protein